jgi:hypothetical protein
MQILRIAFLALAVMFVALPHTAHANFPAGAGDVATVKKFVQAQVDAIKAGDLDKVKAGLSARLRDKVTADNVKKAQAQAAKMTIDDLVDSVEAKPDAKAPTSIKVKMKNGRTLTTIITVDGKWVADTLWFK